MIYFGQTDRQDETYIPSQQTALAGGIKRKWKIAVTHVYREHVIRLSQNVLDPENVPCL